MTPSRRIVQRPFAKALVIGVALALVGGCTSSGEDAADRASSAASSTDGAPVSSTLASVVFENSDGQAFVGSRTTFILTEAERGDTQLVAVEGTVAGATTTVRLAPGTYRVAPASSVQVAPTGSYSVRDLSQTEIVVPQFEDGADLSAAVAKVTFGLDVQRSPFDLRIDDVSSTNATLIWEAIDGADVAGYELRLTEGAVAATSRTDGTAVPLTAPTATTASVDGLEPGREYTATLFGASSAGLELAFRSVSITTAPADGSEAAYALAPNTILPTDFDALAPEVVSEGIVAITLGGATGRSSVTAIPGVAAHELTTTCVVGTPVLVSTEVAGDNAFYGLIASCDEKPASWRRQETTAPADSLESTVALLDTGVPLAAVVPYLSFRSSGFDRCVAQTASKNNADLCETIDSDGDGVGDSTELALGMNPNDPADNWDKRVAATVKPPAVRTPIKPIGDVVTPTDLTSGPLQVSLVWATGDDLDLLVTDPTGATVSARAPSGSGGQMDRDDSGDVTCQSRDTRVENAVWSAAPTPGTYTVQVENFAGSADAPRSPCPGRSQARLEVRVDGVKQLERVITIGSGCPISLEVADGKVTAREYLAVACSYDGTRWRPVSGMTDTNGDGFPSKGDTVSFFEYPTTFDGKEYEKIPMTDCVVTEFEAAFTGPPDLRVRGKDCYVYFRSQENKNEEYLQHRFGADNRRGGGDFDLDILDAIDWPKIKDRIEEAGSGYLVEQKSNKDDAFLRVDFNYATPVPYGWRRPVDTAATPALRFLPDVECEADGEVTFDPQFGIDKFHDVNITIKYTKITWNIEAGVTAYVDPLVEASGSYECGLELEGVTFQLLLKPVPINLELAPTVSGGVEGKIGVSGPRLELTLGVQSEGHVNAAIKSCSPFSWLPDLPCGVNVDADADFEPIARFTAGGIEGSIEGELSAGAGAEATIGIGIKNKFVTAKAGLTLGFQPLVGTISAAASVSTPSIVPGESDGSDPAAGNGAPDAVRFAPPVAYNDFQAIETKNPTATTPDGVAIVGPSVDGACFNGAPMNRINSLIDGKDYAVSTCPDALCPADNNRPIYTYYEECGQAACFIGGTTVSAGSRMDMTAECPQRPMDVAAAAPSPSPPSAEPSTAPPAGGGGPSTGFCAQASVGAKVAFGLRAEFWILAFGTDQRFPIYDADINYPGAKFTVGDCGA